MESKMSGVNKTQVLLMNGILNFTNPIICYQPSSITTNGVWQGQNPLDYSLPLFILQLMIIVITTHLVVIILKPLRQPRVVCEIIAGVLLGPSGFGAIDWIGRNLFPLRSMMILETMHKIGTLYYLFLVGVEMDASLVKRSSRQSIVIAAFSFILPFILFYSLTVILYIKVYNMEVVATNIIYQGITVSFTAFPVVSRILVELKLFNSDLGRKALSSTLIIDICSWVFIIIFLPWVERKDTNQSMYLPILGGIAYLLISFFVIRPAILWIIKSTPEGENYNEFYICLILTGVMICGFITDSIGIASPFGGFIFGLTIPNGTLGTALLEKLEDFVNSLLLPISFLVNGIKVDLTSLNDPALLKSTPLVFGVLLLANITKVLSTFLMCLYFDMQMHESLSLGLLMNTKGIIDIMFLNAGLGNQVIDVYFFTINVIFMVVVMAITTPVIAILYKSSRSLISYKPVTLQKAKMDADLKILLCVHTPRNVPAMINLIEASNATKKSPLNLYVVHLVELTGRASAMLIVHNANKVNNRSSNIDNSAQAHYKQIERSFDNYLQRATNVTIQPCTAISPYLTMHEDIYNLAEDNRINLIIVPFHKQQTVDGGMEPINPALRQLNINVMANAPCSIGILIDRGLGGSSKDVFHHIAVIFIGGADDREALAYAWRMAGQPGVNLTVMRLVPGDDILGQTIDISHQVQPMTNMEREMQLDDEYIGEFKLKTLDQKTLVYKEKVVNNVEDTVATIRGIDMIHDFYIVGRGQGFDSPLVAGLIEFSENPELGAIGDLLASSDFSTTVSVLVVQQYVGEGMHNGGGNKVSPVE